MCNEFMCYHAYHVLRVLLGLVQILFHKHYIMSIFKHKIKKKKNLVDIVLITFIVTLVYKSFILN